MKNIFLIAFAVLGLTCTPCVSAAPTLVGLHVDGPVSEIDLLTGVLTEKASEQITNFTLGGIARKKDTLYYVAAPSGTSEKAIYTLDLLTNTLTHVDLDRAAGDDDVRVMFINKNKVYAIFYNGNAGTAGLYQVDSLTGVTTVVLDLSELNIEIIGGAFAKSGRFFYTLARPETDSTQRQLVKFKLKADSAELIDILSPESTPVLCDRLKVNTKTGKFVCMASPSDSQVDICKLTQKGVATCLSTLANVKRLGGGHTMMTRDGRKFYALVYDPSDENSQRLIQFNAKGVVASTLVIDAILVGAQFDKDGGNPVRPPLTN